MSTTAPPSGAPSDESGLPEVDEATVTITAYADGPLIVRGPAVFLDDDGVPLDAGRRTVALCRCGRSAVKPFCDGSHVATKFRSGPSAHRREQPSSDDA